MAITDSQQIDALIESDGKKPIVLIIFDHLEWNDDDERYTYYYSISDEEQALIHDFVHMLYFYGKVGNYVWAMLGGAIEGTGDLAEDDVVIQFNSMFALNRRGQWIFEIARDLCESQGIDLQFVLNDAEHAVQAREQSQLRRDQRRRGILGPTGHRSPAGHGRSQEELLAAKSLRRDEFPPDLRYDLGLDLEPGDPDYPYPPVKFGDGTDDRLTTDEAADIEVVGDTLIMVVVDEEEWIGGGNQGEPGVTGAGNADFRSDDFMHMVRIWTKIEKCIIAWKRNLILHPDEGEIELALSFRLETVFPVNDNGKWFVDWLKGFLALNDHDFQMKLSSTEDAARRRMEAELNRGVGQDRARRSPD